MAIERRLLRAMAEIDKALAVETPMAAMHRNALNLAKAWIRGIYLGLKEKRQESARKRIEGDPPFD